MLDFSKQLVRCDFPARTCLIQIKTIGYFLFNLSIITEHGTALILKNTLMFLSYHEKPLIYQQNYKNARSHHPFSVQVVGVRNEYPQGFQDTSKKTV
ncbi:hypothetical protein JL09_g5031 [Pichia kudriavzevii]|uniref:Uncharacterized protein n=1 Tax=Pichia kudriavzevii TaxID=4909 RepID=A0A099NV18_PICKU|nr:hypothetical protein JL09_g5031 [Pichia kudriavzevii]